MSIIFNIAFEFGKDYLLCIEGIRIFNILRCFLLQNFDDPDLR